MVRLHKIFGMSLPSKAKKPRAPTSAPSLAPEPGVVNAEGEGRSGSTSPPQADLVEAAIDDGSDTASALQPDAGSVTEATILIPELGADVTDRIFYETKFIEVLSAVLASSHSSSSVQSHAVGWFDRIWQITRRELRTFRLSTWFMKPVGLGWLVDAAWAPDPLARLIVLSRKLSETEPPYGFYREAYFAALLVLRQVDEATVHTVLDDLEYATSRNSPIRTVMTGVSRTIIGTVIALVFASAIYFIFVILSGGNWMNAVTTQYLPFVSTPLFLAALFGMAGSTVSIFFRLGDFEGPTRKSQQFCI
jgi:hypothetical protein